MKYFNSVLKQAKKSKAPSILDCEIGYKNYRCVTDGQRIHGLFTNHNYGTDAISLGSEDWTPPALGFLLDNIPSPTHVLKLDPKQAKTLIKLARLSTFDVIPMILETRGDHVVLSYDSKDGIAWTMDVNSHPQQDTIRIPINGKYLADLLEVSNHWEFAQAEQGKPIYLKADDKLAVVMPMRE